MAAKDYRPGYHPSHRNDGQKNDLKKQGFYKTRAWRRVRLLALQRDNYLCQLRLSKKCTRIATEVHHVKPLADYPELALELSNLTSCCWECHELTKPRGSRPAVQNKIRIIQMGGDGDPG